MTADLVVSQAPIQSEELVPPRSVARRQPSPSCYHALSRILSAAEAAQAGLYRALDPEQQTIILSAGGPGSKSSYAVLHVSATDILRTQRRIAAALRFGMPPDVGSGGTCALRKGADGSVTSHCGVTITPSLLQVRESENKTTQGGLVYAVKAPRTGGGIRGQGAPRL